MYSLSCITKLSQNYGILIVGRVLGGISTSLLFSAFESWYVHEHIQKHDFPTEWLSVTFSKTTFWNGVLAINAGIVANIFAETFNFGPVAPFILALPCLVITGILVATQWDENYGNQSIKFSNSCFEGLRNIVTNQRILFIGAIQSLFESVMYMFVFLWTPILDPAQLPLGIIFSCFMICIMIGSSLYQLLISWHIPVQHLLATSIGIGLVSMILCVLATHPEKIQTGIAFAAFLLLELAVGIYFPSMGYIRSRILPEAQRTGIMNWFRVPLNLIACVGLMWLHTDETKHGNRVIFIICLILLIIAAIFVKHFNTLVKNDQEFQQIPIANGNVVPL